MKKMKKLSVIFLLIICLLTTGCGGSDEVREVKSLDDFNTAFAGKGFVVNDNMSTYANQEYIEGAMVATYGDAVTVEMIVYDSEKNASIVQEGQIDNFDLLKSTGAGGEKLKGGNFYDYMMVSNGYYMVSTRVDNTLIFCKTLLANKDLVESTIDSLGY